MYDNILATIGNTPLVRLTRLFPQNAIRLFAKLEGFNPAGSIKDRAAAHILTTALAEGHIHADTVVIESSSGNMGIGLAQVCAYFKLRFICVIDPKTTTQNIAILRAYGAELDLVTEPDPETGEFLHARIRRVQELLRTVPNSWWTDQYANIANARAHHQTMHEISCALDGQVDYIFCATSTCGTLRGCAEYVQTQGMPTQIVAVDAIGSVIFGGTVQKRLIPGHGAARRPDLYHPDLADRVVLVSDLECVVGCHRLFNREAILAGGSSGAVVMAISTMLGDLQEGATCVMILSDRGERYLDTIYAAAWVHQHFGNVTHLWE